MRGVVLLLIISAVEAERLWKVFGCIDGGKCSSSDWPKDKCLFPGYTPGGRERLIVKATSPQIALEDTMLSSVFGIASGAGYAAAGGLSSITKVMKFAGSMNALGGAFGALMYATEPTAADILNAVQQAIDELTEVVNEKMAEMENYVDTEIVELEKTLMERDFKKMFHQWANCLLATSEDLISECMRETYWMMASSEYSFLTYKDELGIGKLTTCLNGLSTVSEIYQAGNNEQRSLHLAVINEKCDCIDVLLDNGAYIEAKDKHGNTALFYAVKRNYVTCFANLIRRGADFQTTNNNGVKPWTVMSQFWWSKRKPYLPYVFFLNVARGQPTAVKNGEDNGQQSGGKSSYAVDSFTINDYNKNSCTHSKKIDNPWWEVTLREETKVKRVVITNRKKYSGRLNNAKVQLRYKNAMAGTGCTLTRHDDETFSGKAYSYGLGDMAGVLEAEVDCPEDLTDKVRIFLPGKQHLSLCEVEVYSATPRARNIPYELKAGGVTECPAGYEVALPKHCGFAYYSLFRLYKLKPENKVATVDKSDRPYGCTVQMSNGSPTWNENQTPSSSAANGNFRLICKKGSLTVWDKKFLMSLEVSLPVFREYANLVLMSLSTLIQSYNAGSAEHTLYSERLTNSIKTFTNYAKKSVSTLVEGWTEKTCPNIRSLKCKSWDKTDDQISFNKLECECRTNRLYLETEKCKFYSTSADGQTQIDNKCRFTNSNGDSGPAGTGDNSCTGGKSRSYLNTRWNSWKNNGYYKKDAASSADWKDKAKEGMVAWMDQELEVIGTSINNYWQNELLDIIPTWEKGLETKSADSAAKTVDADTVNSDTIKADTINSDAVNADTGQENINDVVGAAIEAMENII